MKKLFVLDLDGTSLKDFTTLHPKTIEGVKHVRELGHDVVIATGRNACTCDVFYHQLELTTPLITANGSSITNPNDDNYKEAIYYVDNNIIDYLRTGAVDEYIDNAYYFNSNSLVVSKYEDSLVKRLKATGCPVKFDSIHNIDTATSIILKVKAENLETALNALKNEFGNAPFNFWQGLVDDGYFIEVNPIGRNKWSAILDIVDDLGIKLSNVYTFGDAMNDYEMIKNCENGVVVNNAIDDLKAVATVVLDETNLDGGVGNFLLQF